MQTKKKNENKEKDFGVLVKPEPTNQDLQVGELAEKLSYEKDARQEERFIFIVLIIMLLDVVFFTVMPTFGGPIALLILELLVLIPLAKRMGMEEIAKLMNRVLDRMVSKADK